MLCINPYFLRYDVGFFLSIGAVVGIYLVQNLLDMYKSRQGVSFLIPLFGATYGVLPWVFLLSEEWNVLSLLANSVVVPLVPVYLFVAILSMLVSGIFEEWTRL
jgi:hypothetical protein